MTNAYIYAPETIIKAYSIGVFPMAQSREDNQIQFYDPLVRGILPINPPHIPRRLLRTIRQTSWQVSINKNFRAVIQGCAEITHSRKDSWINAEIIRLYLALHKMGFAHSFEVWEDAELIGGLYGIRLGSAFFGESMFSHSPDASKVAFYHLQQHLLAEHYSLIDCQMMNPHLETLGVHPMARTEFLARLRTNRDKPTKIGPWTWGPAATASADNER